MKVENIYYGSPHLIETTATPSMSFSAQIKPMEEGLMIYEIKEENKIMTSNDKLEILINRIFGMRLDFILKPDKDPQIRAGKKEVLDELVGVIQGWHKEEQSEFLAPYTEADNEDNA